MPKVSTTSQKVEDLEKELELDLENLNIDENVDTSVRKTFLIMKLR